MDILKEVKHQLNWESPNGKFTTTIINGVITELTFCEIGTNGEAGCTRCLNSVDYKFLKQVHECLGDVFNHLESEALKAGHKFAGDENSKLTWIDLVIDENAKRQIPKIISR